MTKTLIFHRASTDIELWSEELEYLSSAIVLISKSRSSEEGVNAINALNKLFFELMRYDNDHYKVMDILSCIMDILKDKQS